MWKKSVCFLLKLNGLDTYGNMSVCTRRDLRRSENTFVRILDLGTLFGYIAIGVIKHKV